LNLYGYVRGNPVSYVDPLGLLEDYFMVLNGNSTTSLINVRGGSHLVFSGEGSNRNNPDSINVVDSGPLPTGLYYIVDRQSGGILGGIMDWLRGRDSWFALYRDDGLIDDQTNIRGVRRGEFRLHYGTVSKGCVTEPDKNDYKQLHNELMETNTEIIPGTNIPYRGTIRVFAPDVFTRFVDLKLFGV
jgi:hypothetical protein